MKRLLAIGLLLVCAGCGEMSTHSKSDVLTTTLLAYANALRWGDFEQAQSFVDPETLKTHPLSEIDRERYKQVRVASYNERPVVPVGHDEVQQIVEIGILNVNTQTERTIVDRQLWRYDEKTKHWHLVSGLPDITQH
ncbi:MAG TPA: hypothetical protein VFB32_12040 [Rudaea sp.]|nr:hypothetical protein [Rudaea sp.]